MDVNLYNKKILILGGAGFIGSYLTEKLSKNNKVICYDRLSFGCKIENYNKNIQIVKRDIRDLKSLKKFSKNVDIIFHLAAIVGVDVVAKSHLETMNEEFENIKNIFICMKKNKIKRLIYTSTSGVYGDFNYKENVKENDPASPTSSYAVAKLHTEFYIKYNALKNKINCIIVRPFNVYGHRQDSRMVIPRMIKKAKQNKPILVYYDGKQTRDFTYIDDFINCLISLCQKKGYAIYNFAKGRQDSIYNLAKIIKKKLNSKSKIKFIDPKKNILDFQVKKRCGNINKYFKDFKYKPETSLKDGLDKIIKILYLKK